MQTEFSHNRPFPINARRSDGFTLLEVLTAMVILAIVVTLVFGSFNGVFSNANQINAGSDLFEMGSTCLTRIRNDLLAVHVSLYPRYKIPDMDAEPDLYRVVADQQTLGGESFARLRFTSLSHLPLNQDTRDGIAEIVYYPQRTEDRGIILRRSDHLFPYPEFEENTTDPVMCEMVRTFEMVYYDYEGREFTDWNSDEDDYEYGTPLSVSIRLVVGTEDESFTFSTEIRLPMYRYEPVKR